MFAESCARLIGFFQHTRVFQMSLTAEQIQAIEDKYQADLVGPMSKNHDAARYAARALIEKRYALGELNDDERAAALQAEFGGVGGLANQHKYNREPPHPAAKHGHV